MKARKLMQTNSEPVSNEPTRSLASDLEEHGITIIPDLVSGDQLSDMQRAFEARLKRLSWNDFSGYEKTTRNRHMVQDVLTLEQGFVDAALHPVVKETLNDYLGSRYELVEAKGWLSLAPRQDFHAWHGDMWYDKDQVKEPPREAKLAIYLTDVTSGAFVYIRGTHGKMEPRVIRDHEIGEYDESQIVEVKGSAGTGILFDTSGVHRQGVPILEPRQAVFYCYHDPSVPLQKEDVDYNRYHPLVLNAALLGGIDSEDRRILGFGNKTNFVPAFERSPRHEGLQRLSTGALEAKLVYEALRDRVRGRLRRVVRSGQ
jgi:hypothetical protein